MGTRGLYGFVKDGETKATYNHMDSYPSGLGEHVLNFILRTPVETMKQIFDRIELVEEGEKPTREQKERMMAFNPLLTEVYFEGTDVWYSVLHDYMGDMDAFTKGLPFMIDSIAFIHDSLFCEWAYLVNLDDEVLEVYKGFQEQPDINRYHDPDREYGDFKNCRWVKTIPFRELKPGQLENFEAMVNDMG